MGLKDVIMEKGKEKMVAKMSKNDAFKNESELLRAEIIEKYGKRVGKMCRVMQMIMDYDPELWDKIKPEAFFQQSYLRENPMYFYTNGIDHCLGFYGNLEEIGQEAGGANGKENFIVSEDYCYFEMRGPEDDDYINFWSRECAKKFAEKFEQFEDRFRKFVDDNYGKGTYDMEE